MVRDRRLNVTAQRPSVAEESQVKRLVLCHPREWRRSSGSHGPWPELPPELVEDSRTNQLHRAHLSSRFDAFVRLPRDTLARPFISLQTAALGYIVS
jgi:hypothetical protein